MLLALHLLSQSLDGDALNTFLRGLLELFDILLAVQLTVNELFFLESRPEVVLRGVADDVWPILGGYLHGLVACVALTLCHD